MMTQRANGAGAILIAFALMGLIVPTYVLAPADAAHAACQREGVSIKMEGITDHVAIESYSFSVSNPQQSGAGGQGSSKPTISEIVVTKRIDENTPKILDHILKSRIIPKVHIQVCYNIGGTGQGQTNLAMFEIWLDKVRICSYTQNGSTDNLPPSETFSFCFEKMMTKYTPPPEPPMPPDDEPNNDDEQTEQEYDLKTNR